MKSGFFLNFWYIIVWFMVEEKDCNVVLLLIWLVIESKLWFEIDRDKNVGY